MIERYHSTAETLLCVCVWATAAEQTMLCHRASPPERKTLAPPNLTATLPLPHHCLQHEPAARVGRGHRAAQPQGAARPCCAAVPGHLGAHAPQQHAHLLGAHLRPCTAGVCVCVMLCHGSKSGSHAQQTAHHGSPPALPVRMPPPLPLPPVLDVAEHRAVHTTTASPHCSRGRCHASIPNLTHTPFSLKGPACCLPAC